MWDGLHNLLQDNDLLASARQRSLEIAPKFELSKVIKRYLIVFEEVIQKTLIPGAKGQV